MMTVVKGLVTFRPMFALVLLSALVGCASAPKKAPPPSSFDATMSRAEAEVTNGGPEQALKTFEDAGRADPTRKEPWVRIAQLQFDRANYARAIVAAQEVLQRDPNDLVADGVLTVAGFRIANQSLQRLQAAVRWLRHSAQGGRDAGQHAARDHGRRYPAARRAEEAQARTQHPPRRAAGCKRRRAAQANAQCVGRSVPEPGRQLSRSSGLP